MARFPAGPGVWLWGLLCAVSISACTTNPTEPSALGMPITVTYRSLVPPEMPWPVDVCGDPARDHRPSLTVNWRAGEMAMAQDLVDPAVWRARAAVPTEVRVDVTVRDPGLCRASFAPFGEFAWAGVAVNDVPMPAVAAIASVGRTPCFRFRVTRDGEIVLDASR